MEHACEFDREMSSGHFVKMYKLSHVVTYTCKWFVLINQGGWQGRSS